MQTGSMIRVAVDIGGTFTDLHLHDPGSDRILAWKTPSTPADLSVGLVNGLHSITELAGLKIGDIDLILHGSTIATNAVLERKLPRGALITTAGFRDILEIGRHIRRDVYTLKAEPRSLLIPRQYRYEVPERIIADGSVRVPLDEAALRQIIDQLLLNSIEAVAIVFLHGYRNPQHEQRAAEIVREHAPQISLTTSFESSAEIREFERTSTTVLNALLRPVISGYLQRVTGRLQEEGVNAALYLVQSNGGLATPADAARLPAKLLLSGPAGGAMAMASLARRHGLDNLVGFDMGGTSSDISVVRDGVVGETSESSIDGLPVRLPMVEIRTIGAGGGSIARLESTGLRVGPESAGAEPGPVCYQRGGTQPTVTDANAVLHRIDASGFRTGGMTLNIEASCAAIENELGHTLGLSVSETASGIVDVANTNMAAAIRLSLFEKGADPDDFAIAPFGGAAGLHACSVAVELGIRQIVFPAHASTLSALGILQADLRHDLSVSKLLPSSAESMAALTKIVADLHAKATLLLSQNGFLPEQQRVEFSCDMRYRGQAFELATPWSEVTEEPVVTAQNVRKLVSAFHLLHEQRFAYASPQDATEIVTVRAAGLGILGSANLETQKVVKTAEIDVSRATTSTRHRTLHLHGKELSARCIRREELSPGHGPIDGPLIIEEDYTVLLIEKGWSVQMLPTGDLRADHLEDRNSER